MTLAPPRGMNPEVRSYEIADNSPRHPCSKYEWSMISDCWDISIWKSLTQCDGNANAHVHAHDRGDYNSSLCTSYTQTKNVSKWEKKIPVVSIPLIKTIITVIVIRGTFAWPDAWRQTCMHLTGSDTLTVVIILQYFIRETTFILPVYLPAHQNIPKRALLSMERIGPLWEQIVSF